MKSKIGIKITAGVLATGMALGCCAGCAGEVKEYFDNETDTLSFSTLAVDQVFNPFFYTSGTDGNVVGMTQLSMLTNDGEGNPVCGPNEATIAQSFHIETKGTPNVDPDCTTTYYFVLKNNVQFSNGSYLTMKDVLFNYYVYLDPVYSGSSTIYSTDIVGLQEYRTQEDDENEQKAFMEKFETIAGNRINNLSTAATNILKDAPVSGSMGEEEFETALKAYADENGDAYANIEADYAKAVELFKEELERDYSNSLDSWQDTSFADETGKVYKPFTTDVEVFLYNENYITWNKKEAKLVSALTNNPEELKGWTKEQAINTVFSDKIPNSIVEIVNYWGTSMELRTYLTNAALEEYFKTHERKHPNISGIQFANRTQPVTVNGVEYPVPTYKADGSVQTGNEVLSITIKNVDPKAIWNFALSIAPMYYYSDAEHIAAFDYESNFGVEYGSQTFMSDVLNGGDKVGVPVGAGPYAASKASGGIENITRAQFYDNSMIYFERNPYYVQGPAKIKKVRMQVASAAAMINSLYTKEIDFVEPNAKPETISELDGKRNEGFGYKTVYTAGYGYIGINAGKVPTLKVRQAIMHAINPQECSDYYGAEAQTIYRSMSKENWAYPKNATSYYPYIGDPVPENLDVVNPDYKAYVETLGKKAGDKFTEDEQLAFIKQLVENAGYHINANGVYTDDTNVLKYTFTIAGAETDHPAFNALNHARELLNKAGFQVTVSTDSNALSKLTTGDLAVWAAAWSSTIDPDMYQVYHKDSKASSTLNWGYRQIILNAGNKYAEENRILNELTELIDSGREYTDQGTRRDIYAKALDLVMELAIELPTYQRKDLFAYNANKIDATTFNQDCTSYKGLTSDLYQVSLIVEK